MIRKEYRSQELEIQYMYKWYAPRIELQYMEPKIFKTIIEENLPEIKENTQIFSSVLNPKKSCYRIILTHRWPSKATGLHV